MIMSLRKKFLSALTIFCIYLLTAGQASAVIINNVLPYPPDGGAIFMSNIPDPSGTLRDAIMIDGIPVAYKYDDAWSYSAKLLDALQDAGELSPGFGDFQFAAGTGGLDVLIASGIGKPNSNQGVGPGGSFNFENHVRLTNGSTTTAQGWWGQDDQLNDGSIVGVNGPVTVGQVLDYLHAFNPLNNIPVFYMDLNQKGKEASMFFSARISLFDADNDAGGGVVHEWSMDTETQPGDGTFDIAAMILAAGEVTVTGTSGNVYEVDHNKGSGKPDFIVFIETLDLSLYDIDDYFIMDFHMAGLNNGFEEIFLTGAISPFGPPTVPEPGTLVLLGSGLIGLAIYSRRRLRR